MDNASTFVEGGSANDEDIIVNDCNYDDERWKPEIGMCFASLDEGKSYFASLAGEQCTFNDLAGEQPIFNEQIINETAEDHDHHVESNMHTRRAKNPRNLKNSAAVRTPYETFGVSKKEKNRRK